MKQLGRMSPHNCTVCQKFEGNLVFRSDDEPDIETWQDVIWIDCGRFGKRYCNNELIVCGTFLFDPDKESLVVRDPEFKGSMLKIYKRAFVRDEIGELERRVYNMVSQVQDIDARGYLFRVCINRVHLETGISREAIFRCVMDMVESGYLVREQVMGESFLRTPSAVHTVAEVLEIGKRKVIT